MAETDALRDDRVDAAPATAEAAQRGTHMLTCALSLLTAVRQQAEAGAALKVELGAEIEQLKAAVRELKANNAALVNEAKAERFARMRLEGDDKARLIQINAMKKDKGELTSHLNVAAEASTRCSRRLADLEKSHAKLLTKLYGAERKCGELERKHRAASEQLAAAKANRNPSQEENANLRVQLEALETVNNNQRSVINALNAKYYKLQTEFQAACDKLRTVTRDGASDPELRAQADKRSTTVSMSSETDNAIEAAMTQLRSANEALQAEVSALKAEVQDFASVRSAHARLTSENATLRATIQRLDNQLRNAEVARRNFDAKCLTEFMERTFACTGKKELLGAAFVAFYDNKALDASGGGRFAPKPVLLVHQVEIPQVAVVPATAVSLAPPTVASEGPDDTRSADSATSAVLASQRKAEEEEKKQEGSSEGEQSEEEGGDSRDRSSHETPASTLSRKRGRHARNQDPQLTEQRAAPPPSRTDSEPSSAKHRRTTAGADNDAAPLLSVLSNPRRPATHYRAIAPRPPQPSVAFYDADGGQLEVPRFGCNSASLSSLTLPTAARDRSDKARAADGVTPAVPVSQERQQEESAEEEEEKREESGEDVRSQEEEGEDRDRHNTPSRPLTRQRGRHQRSQEPQRIEQRAGPPTAKHRQTTGGSTADAGHLLSVFSNTRWFSTRGRSRAPTPPPPRSVRFEPDSHVDQDDVVSINEIDLRLLYEAEPWEAMYEKRPLFSHTVDYSSLSPGAKRWLETALAFRHKYRRQLWEQQHWVVVARPHGSTTLARMLEERAIRQAQARFAWNTLVDKSDDIIRRGDLDLDVWHDPFLWRWTDEPRQWHPRSCNLVEELEALDEMEPARCFYVDCLCRHPFFAGRLAPEYQEPHRLPPGF